MQSSIKINTIEDISLDNSFEIEKIIHISDIHIKSSKKQEYENVFSKFYKFLSNTTTPNSIVVITGDIIDNETDSQCIKMTKDFIINICNYCGCLLIPGNHDINTSNKLDDLNKMTAIIENTQHKHPYYLLSNDGYYHFKNVSFLFTSLFSNEILKPTPDSKRLNIGLYHGRIKEVMDIQDFKTNSGTFSIKEFFDLKYDYVLLGDIHKRQIIKDTNNKAFYAGSLIQQKIDEEPYGGGYVLNIKDSILTDFIIENEDAVFRIELDESTPIDTNSLPDNAKYQIISKYFKDDLINNFKVSLQKKNKMIKKCDVIYKYDQKFNANIKIGETEYNLSKIGTKDNIYDLILKFIENKKEYMERKII